MLSHPFSSSEAALNPVAMRAARFACAGLLTAAGILGTLYSIRAAKAHQRYHAITYGKLAEASTDRMASEWDRAHALYPHNYFLCIKAVEGLWTAAFSDGEIDGSSAMEQFDRWCARGIELNPHHWKLHRAVTLRLAPESPKAAADYWEQFVEWQFWSPRNLCLLVECYARAGRLAEASETLELLEGRETHARAAAALQRAWARELSVGY
ncbi:MAG: hypothetical protein HN341_13500 [Verrucomicrobia bacterium]|nr:hypothetical protein [Verrucomicrobiota bacterium]